MCCTSSFIVRGSSFVGGIESSNKPIGARNVLGLSNKKGGEWFENTIKLGSIAIFPLLLALGLNNKAFTLKFNCNFNKTINITITKHIAQTYKQEPTTLLHIM
jgi:hypothetical protein